MYYDPMGKATKKIWWIHGNIGNTGFHGADDTGKDFLAFYLDPSSAELDLFLLLKRSNERG